MAAAAIRATGMPQNRDKTCKIKCCVIEGVVDTAIVVRVTPSDPTSNSGCWAEKKLGDCIASHEPWTVELNFADTPLIWWHNNVRQDNNREFPIRMFVMYVKALPATEDIVELAREICRNLNASLTAMNAISVDEQNLFWLPRGAVWSDILGCDEALRALIRDCNSGYPRPGFYDNHTRVIHTYFRAGTFSRELAQILHAPTAEIHPSVLQQVPEGAYFRGGGDDGDDDGDDDAIVED
jgi:hypothetical protein